jgi:hypothetical protein
MLEDGFAHLALLVLAWFGGRHLTAYQVSTTSIPPFVWATAALRLRDHRGLRRVRGFRMTIVQEYGKGVRDDAVVHRRRQLPAGTQPGPHVLGRRGIRAGGIIAGSGATPAGQVREGREGRITSRFIRSNRVVPPASG